MISKLKLVGFYNHKNKEVEFKPGINIIVGKNRAGKTSLLEAFTFAYWGKTKNSKLQNLINFDSKQADVCITTIKAEGVDHNLNPNTPSATAKKRGRSKKTKIK